MHVVLNVLLGVSMPVILVLVGIIYKQNKESRTSLTETVNKLTEAIDAIKKELQTYREGWIDRREVLLGIVAQHCADAQSACRGNFNLRLDGLKEGQENVCVKIDELKLARNQKWEQQENLNRNMLAHVNDTKLHNKTEKG